MMEVIKEVNFRRLRTRFSVSEVATDVIRFTPAIHAYLKQHQYLFTYYLHNTLTESPCLG